MARENIETLGDLWSKTSLIEDKYYKKSDISTKCKYTFWHYLRQLTHEAVLRKHIINVNLTRVWRISSLVVR